MVLELFLFNPLKIESQNVKQKQKKVYQERWENVTAANREPYEKKARDHVAKQSVMKEAVIDALQKEKGVTVSGHTQVWRKLPVTGVPRKQYAIGLPLSQTFAFTPSGLDRA